MRLITLNAKNEIIEIIKNNDTYIMSVLLKQLWLKTMKVTNDVKRIDYSYNYSDKQMVKITFKNNMKYIFEDIPTTHGVIDIDTILKGGE